MEEHAVVSSGASGASRRPGGSLAVESTGVEKSFGAGETRVRVLRGTNFWARTGEKTFLVGPSGCGKTTLISVIGAILTADEGTVRVLGSDLTVMKRSRLARFRLNNVGFVFQQFNLLPSLSATENASLPLVARGVSTGRAEKRARGLLERLGLGEHSKKMPAQLSGGQQQRVAIARSLVHDPKLVVCDEPTASLDAESGREVMELLREVAIGAERAVIVVTHDNRIFRFADTVHHMADGRIHRTESGRAAAEAGVV